MIITLMFSFSACQLITDKGILNISSLGKLIYLKLRNLKNIKTPSLEKLKNLIALDCEWSEIEEKSLITFLQQAHYLRSLNVINCDNITKSLLDVAVEVLKAQKSPRMLDLNVPINIKNHVKFLDEKPFLLNVTSTACFNIDKYDIENSTFNKNISRDLY